MKTNLLPFIAIALAACNGPTSLDEHPCPPGGTTLTYENFGKGFIDSRCQTCHAAHSLDRRGAPSEHYFDTRDDVVRQRDRIFIRSAADNKSMPPGPDDPSDADREKLADWLACGAN
jgi:uncharacterized membrane protein